MKIVFVIPGTKITFLEDATTAFGDSYSLQGAIKDYSPRKGDQLQVSQVYIRKNGWFESSLTFKAIGGPIMNRISQNKLANDLEFQKKELLSEEAKIVKLDSLGMKVEWFVQRHKIENNSRLATTQRQTTIEEFSGEEKKTKKELTDFYLPSNTSSGYSGFYNYSGTYFDRYNSVVLVRSEINERIKVLKKKIAKPPTIGKINATFRVKLKDIESWEVEIER